FDMRLLLFVEIAFLPLSQTHSKPFRKLILVKSTSPFKTSSCATIWRLLSFHFFGTKPALRRSLTKQNSSNCPAYREHLFDPKKIAE
ncbi:MAG: hypothetical protein KAU94_08470, partial [Verrucomicrobia bacterium]|nr:hypothetical protein [Verrucomicrobiota bacterium]